MSDIHRSIDSIVSAYGAAAVTPHDTNTIPVPRAIYVGGTGNIVVNFPGALGTDITFANVPAGILPIQPARVKSTGTTATSIVALY